MGCLCSMKKTMNDAADQSSDTPSSSSPPPPPPPQPPQWNSPPTLLIPPQPRPPPLQSSPAEQMPSRPPPTPLLIPTVRSARPRRAPIYRGSVISRRVLIEQRGRPPPSPHRVPIERRASPPPSSRRVPTERRSSPLPSAHHVLSERRGRPLPSPLRVPIERIANPPPSSRHVPTKRSTSLLSSPRRVPIERNTSPPPGTSSLFEPSFKGPSVAASSSSVPSAEMKKHSQNFTFRDLAIATENFSNANFLGEGGFGNVYKGKLDSGEVVAVKVLRKMGVQGNKEFLTEVLMLTMLKHPNLVGLVGFCSEGDQRLLVYEFMPNGTLLDHLSDLPPNREPLDWNTRIKIIVGVANGLHYLHNLADPPIIYRDMKAENILLDDDFNPKLSDFGLTKLAPAGDDEAYVLTRILENQGYCDPEYVATGKLSKKSDVYSFGILMLELISGRRVYDETAPRLLAWASAFLSDTRLYAQLVDPLLQGRFRRRSLNILAPVIGFCTNCEPCLRPPIKDVVKAVADAASFSYDSQPSAPSTASPQSSASLWQPASPQFAAPSSQPSSPRSAA